MSTFEHRLQTVEYGLSQFRTETIKAYQDVAMELAMIKGLTTDSVKRLTALKIQMDQHFDATTQQFADVRLQFVEVKQEVTEVKQDIAEVKQDIAGVKLDITEVKQEVTEVKQDIAGVKLDIAEMKLDVNNLHQRFDRLEILILDRLPPSER